MSAPYRHAALILTIFLHSGCDGSPTATKGGLPPPVTTTTTTIPPGTASMALVGRWEGSSTVESINGVVPQCTAPFWRPGFTDALVIEGRLFDDGVRPRDANDMALHQQASEACHVRVVDIGTSIVGGPWPYDEFDCALVPSLCGLGCHFRMKSSEWNCEGTPPDVWIVGTTLNATFTDAAQNRVEGTMEIGYDHRPGDSEKNARYTGMTVVTSFKVHKRSP